MAAYQAPRAIGVGGVYSRLIVASQGITAGSGFAPPAMSLLPHTLQSKYFPNNALAASNMKPKCSPNTVTIIQNEVQILLE